MSLHFNEINISVPTETNSGGGSGGGGGGGGGSGSSPHMFPAITFGPGATRTYPVTDSPAAFFGGSSGSEHYNSWSTSTTKTFYAQSGASAGNPMIAPRDGYLMIYVHAPIKLISGTAQFTLEVWSKATGSWVQSAVSQLAAPSSTMLAEGETESYAPDNHDLSLTKIIQVTKDEEIGVILKGEWTGTITLGGTGGGWNATPDPYKYMEIQCVLLADGVVGSSGGSTTPGGSNTQIQFNNSGAFGGDANLSYNPTTLTLRIGGTVSGTSTPGEIQFYEGSNYVGFKAPALTGDQIWTLPAADGSANQVLKTDGGGTLSWTDNSGAGASDLNDLSDCTVNITNFTNSLLIGRTGTGTLSSASDNIGIGVTGVFAALSSGTNNIAIGSFAGTALTTGSGNSLIGYESGKALTSSNNTALGYQSLMTATLDSNNTAIGFQAMKNSVGADNNVAIGSGSGLEITGNHNVCIGGNAGYVTGAELTTGSNNVLLGDETSPSSSGASNQIVIGKDATGQADNSVTLGNADVTDVYMAQDSGATVHCGGIVGIPGNPPGPGAIGAGAAPTISILKQDGIITTTINLDLKGLSRGDNTQVVGKVDGGAAYITKITHGINGTLYNCEVICVEVVAGDSNPAPTNDDFDLYSSETGTYVAGNGQPTGGNGRRIINAADFSSLYSITGRNGVDNLAAINSANTQYIYLSGGDGGTAGEFTAGKLIIRLFGFETF